MAAKTKTGQLFIIRNKLWAALGRAGINGGVLTAQFRFYPLNDADVTLISGSVKGFELLRDESIRLFVTVPAINGCAVSHLYYEANAAANEWRVVWKNEGVRKPLKGMLEIV